MAGVLPPALGRPVPSAAVGTSVAVGSLGAGEGETQALGLNWHLPFEAPSSPCQIHMVSSAAVRWKSQTNSSSLCKWSCDSSLSSALWLNGLGKDDTSSYFLCS